MRMELAKLADGLGMKPRDGKGKIPAIGDPEARKEPYEKYMYDNYYSIGTDDDPYSGRRLNKMLS
jgi:hypothetical protein